MPIAEPKQLTFAGGVNAQAAPDKIADGEVVTATNIDFSLEDGAAVVRRGSVIHDTVTGSTDTLFNIHRSYSNPTSIGQSPFYVMTTDGIYRGANNIWTEIVSTGSPEFVAIGTYRDYTVFSPVYGQYYKDDGTNCTDWIKQAPANAPALSTVVVATLAVLSNGSIFEGTGTYTSGTFTASSTDSQYRVVMQGTVSSTNLAEISGVAIGDYGVDYLSLAANNPKAVLKISRDYSIGDSSFNNYFHAEVSPQFDGGVDLIPGVDVYLEGQPITGNDATAPVSRAARADIMQGGRGRGTRPATEGAVGRSPSTLYTWAVARPNFQLVGQYAGGNGADPWSNIQAVRITVECTSSCLIQAGNWYIQGDAQHSLTDPQIGYNYWVTFATLDSNGVVLDESAPSPVLDNVRVSQGQVVVTHTGTATGSHGITHRIYYRQGGLLADPYAVSTQTALSAGALITTATLTDTVPDIQAVTQGFRLTGSMYSKATFPNVPAAVAEYQGRLFVLYENVLMWSLPGKVGSFPKSSYTEVSSKGDEGRALHVYGNTLVIVNRDSVYTMRGSIFEGPDANWVLSRSSARHGSKAPRVSKVRTPYGVLMLDYDGVFLFDPSTGAERELDWITDKAGDLFKGAGATDPASLKGSRVPVLNRSYIITACAAFANNKLYLGLPTGANTTPYTILVADFKTQRVWFYNYGVLFTDMFWDFVDNKLLVTTVSNGRILQIETGLYDESLVGGVFNNITYSIKPKMISAPDDFRLENMTVELQGGTTTALAVVDKTSTVTLGTFSGTNRDWNIPPFSGQAVNNVQLEFTGAASTASSMAMYAVGFTGIPEPQQVRYWRTEYDNNGHTGENLWDVHHASLDIVGTGTVTGVMFVDGSAVMTNTYVGPTNARTTFHRAYPARTYGNIAYTTYTSTSDSLRIKHFDTWNSARKEPPPVNSFRSEVTSLDENICDAHNVDINPNGTVTAIVYVDNTAVGTYSYTGTNQQSYVSALPNEVYGRTIYAHYTGSGFKHYNTWWDLRPEPDRMTNYVVTRESKDEMWWRNVNYDINPLGGTVLSTVYVDGTVVATKTASGSLRQSFVDSLPDETMGRTIWTVHNAQGTGKFKHYNTWFDSTAEPDRVTLWHERIPYSSENYIKTWVAELNPGGVCYGTMLLDGTAVWTATFSGTRHQVFNEGVDMAAFLAQSTGTVLDIIYNASPSNRLKHYSTQCEAEPKPFGKKTWQITYRKVGGAGRLDNARSYSLDLEVVGTATVTGIWYVDGRAYHTNTLTYTGREWKEWLPLPPDGRGYLFHQEIKSSTPFRVWGSTLDTFREGAKGVARSSYKGAPA